LSSFRRQISSVPVTPKANAALPSLALYLLIDATASSTPGAKPTSPIASPTEHRRLTGGGEFLVDTRTHFTKSLCNNRHRTRPDRPALNGFAVALRDSMPMSEHLVKSRLHRPGESGIHQRTARQHELDPIRQPRPDSDVLEFVPVNPFLEGSFHLLVGKILVGGVGCMDCDPTHSHNAEHHPRALFDASGFFHHVDRWKRRSEQPQSVLALVKRKHLLDGRFNHDALHESRHSFQSKRNVPRRYVEGAGTRTLKEKWNRRFNS